MHTGNVVFKFLLLLCFLETICSAHRLQL